MKKVSIANIIISIIIVIIAGVLFYNNRYNISNDMDNTEMYVMLRNMEVNANTQWQEFPDNKKLQNDSLSLFIRNLKTPTLMLRIKETSCQSCIFNELDRVRDLIENGVNCIILTTYNNPSIARKILCTKGCKDVTFFNISYDCMYEWYVVQLEVPYYFVLHPNKKASDFFLPEKSKPDITDSYIKSIARICSVNGVSINNKYK